MLLPLLLQGYAFCEFADPQVIANVINGLHAKTLERKVCCSKRAGTVGHRERVRAVRNRAGGQAKQGWPETPVATSMLLLVIMLYAVLPYCWFKLPSLTNICKTPEPKVS